MDRNSKWAVAGSLAWLVVAVGVILGTEGGAAFGAWTIEAQNASPAAAASVNHSPTVHEANWKPSSGDPLRIKVWTFHGYMRPAEPD